jgi:hypothetical protein
MLITTCSTCNTLNTYTFTHIHIYTLTHTYLDKLTHEFTSYSLTIISRYNTDTPYTSVGHLDLKPSMSLLYMSHYIMLKADLDLPFHINQHIVTLFLCYINNE